MTSSPPTQLSAVEVGPTSTGQPKQTPPPLPSSASRLPPERALADAACAERMLERLAAGDYVGALTAADALLVRQPRHGDALDCAQIARSELRKLYVARLGSLERVPHLTMGPPGLLALPLDFGAGFVLSRIDEVAALGDIVSRCGLPPLDALRILSELYLQRVIDLDEWPISHRSPSAPDEPEVP
jgi:hypothetical protein